TPLCSRAWHDTPPEIRRSLLRWADENVRPPDRFPLWLEEVSSANTDELLLAVNVALSVDGRDAKQRWVRVELQLRADYREVTGRSDWGRAGKPRVAYKRFLKGI